MNLRAKTLLSVDVTHAYYASGCTDLDFVVPPATAALLRAARMLARVVDGRLVVLYEADDAGAPRVDISGQALLFGLRLLNPYFDNFTEPPPFGRPLVPLWANAAAPGQIDGAPTGVLLASSFYAHDPLQAARPVTLALCTSAGATVASRVLDAPGPAPAFDLRSLPPGTWTVTEDYGAGPQPAIRLVRAPGLDSATWGFVSLTVDASFAAAPPAFTLTFVARQQTLQYYVVGANYAAAEFALLDVEDAGFADADRDELKFDRIAPGAFTADDIAPDLLATGSTQLALFQTKTPTPRQDRGPQHINLRRNGDVLIENLPQPGAERAQARLVIQLSKP